MAYNTEKFEQLLQQAANNVPSLTTLSLSCAGLSQQDLTRLSHALVGNTHITTLDLGANNLTDEGVKILMPALAQNRTIMTLNLSESNIGPEGARALAQNNTITTLYLSGNNIGNEDARDLAKNNTITTLDLSFNNIGPEGASALAQNNIITTLYLRGNNIGNEGARELAQNNTITTLDLSGNNIGNEGTRELAQNNTITTLNLDHNNIGPEGASALAQNRTITTLDLSYNNIGNEGARELAQNNTITTLNLRDNNISDEGASALLEALKKNTSLIRFEWNDLISCNTSVYIAIQEEIKINQACPQVIKEHIQTLMKLRTLEPTSLLARTPMELMFYFFKELMPGFNPHTFMQMEFPPADEETLTKARNKLIAIAAQRGLSIRLEPSQPSTSSAVPTCPPIRAETSITTSSSDTEESKKPTTVCQALRLAPLPTHFYAVTEQTLLAREEQTEFSPAEQRQLLQPENRCFLYSTAEQARTKLTSITKPAGFFRTTTPLLFRVTTNAPLAEFTEGMPVECRQLNTIMSYRQGAALEQTELLQAHQATQQIKQLVTQAYQAYETASMPSTSTSSSEADNSRQLGQTYGPAELALAAAFKNSLDDLAYPELIQAIKDYTASVNGHVESEPSFMASLYQQFIQHYGTPAQKDNLPTATINEETFLEAIAQMELVVKQQALQGFNQDASPPAPRRPQRAMS